MSSGAKHFQPFVMAEERAARSVFVGNIPYEATEEQLKEIFCQAGPVVSFRLVYDRETGKPKGYGFCEYQDVETAQSAMRNLNNHDFNGRPLRVGVAAGEQTKDESRALQQALGGPISESPYGEPVDADKAPEAISRAVASLPPEQMFELMKQMKLCIQNNPNEARNMLLQNPQLAYALLQAQIVMKIVDPQVALAMLHRQTEQIPPVMPSGNGQALQHQSAVTNLPVDSRSLPLSGPRPSVSTTPPLGFNISSGAVVIGNRLPSRGSLRGDNVPTDARELVTERQSGLMGDRRDLPLIERHSAPLKDWQEFQALSRRDVPFSLVDHHGATVLDNAESHNTDLHKVSQAECHGFSSLERREIAPVERRDMGYKNLHAVSGDSRGVIPSETSVLGLSPRTAESKAEFGLKVGPVLRPVLPGGINQRPDINMIRMGVNIVGPRHEALHVVRQGAAPGNYKLPMREAEPIVISKMDVGPEIRDPRQAAEMRRNLTSQGPVPRMMSSTLSSISSSTSQASTHDQEKAALIMQVLQLSDEQISMLPIDQRQSILILKEQIARSANQGDG